MPPAVRHRRLTITLPEATLEALDRAAPRQQRSRLIDHAVSHYLEEQRRLQLRESLMRGALARAEDDEGECAEWFEVEQEAWDHHLADSPPAANATRPAGRKPTAT